MLKSNDTKLDIKMKIYPIMNIKKQQVLKARGLLQCLRAGMIITTTVDFVTG